MIGLPQRRVVRSSAVEIARESCQRGNIPERKLGIATEAQSKLAGKHGLPGLLEMRNRIRKRRENPALNLQRMAWTKITE